MNQYNSYKLAINKPVFCVTLNKQYDRNPLINCWGCIILVRTTGTDLPVVLLKECV